MDRGRLLFTRQLSFRRRRELEYNPPTSLAAGPRFHPSAWRCVPNWRAATPRNPSRFLVESFR